jgi:hypothetical protein
LAVVELVAVGVGVAVTGFEVGVGVDVGGLEVEVGVAVAGLVVAVGVKVGVPVDGTVVGVGVEGVPETLISTKKGEVPLVPIPNNPPEAFFNCQ